MSEPLTHAHDAATPDVAFSGWFEGRVHVLPVRIYYEDTDTSGIVYHANYLRYCERGRSDFLRMAGVRHLVMLEGETKLVWTLRRIALFLVFGHHGVNDGDVDAVLPCQCFDRLLFQRGYLFMRLLEIRLRLLERRLIDTEVPLKGRAEQFLARRFFDVFEELPHDLNDRVDHHIGIVDVHAAA